MKNISLCPRHVVLVAVVLMSISCTLTNTEFQKDADIIRLKHLQYYGQLLDSYHQATGQYPFQGKFDVPLYVYVAHDQQIDGTRKGPPYAHEVMSFGAFVEEIESVLGREIDEYYDPQYRADYKPNFYIYMITGDAFFFAVHVHQEFPFANKVANHYNKVEISNRPNDQNRAQSFLSLIEDERFKTELHKKVVKLGFFAEREKKYLRHTKE